jgi:AcrR family transcriptional regulator
MSSKLSEPKTRDAERSRAAILEAAEELFAERGFGGVSLQEIGEQAGVSRGTPGYFFGSKEELYRVVLEHAMGKAQQILEGLKPLAVQQSPGLAIELAVRGYMQFLIENPRFMRLVQWESLSRNSFLQESPGNTRVFQESAEVIGQLFGKAGDERQLMLSLMGLCWFPLVHGANLKHALGMDLREPEALEQHVEHIVRLLSSAYAGSQRRKK